MQYTIQEVKERKQKLEQEIELLLANFMEDTGATVEALGVTILDNIRLGSCTEHIAKVKLSIIID